MGASKVALVVKNPPATQETLREVVSTLCREEPLEEEMAIHSSIFT